MSNFSHFRPEMDIATFVLREAQCKWRRSNLLEKQVFLVEKENDGCVCEPFVVAD